MSCQAISTESRSTMTMGVEHFDSGNKWAGWGKKEWLQRGAAWAGRRVGADRGVGEWRAAD